MAGLSLIDADTLVRHGLPTVMIVDTNGIRGLEGHPMRQLHGHAVATDPADAYPRSTTGV
ncbi:hypothetical protein [Actinomadura hibisca]|uniref:hypothetical protein n=1 Tax=Actinomadura hibisca TaxID=68565 RepID=UPI000831A05B|nr:hypothetical protein [Actinomadura hibisca]